MAASSLSTTPIGHQNELTNGEALSIIRRRLPDGTAYRAVKVPHTPTGLEGPACRARLEHPGPRDRGAVLLGRRRPRVAAIHLLSPQPGISPLSALHLLRAIKEVPTTLPRRRPRRLGRAAGFGAPLARSRSGFANARARTTRERLVQPRRRAVSQSSEGGGGATGDRWIERLMQGALKVRIPVGCTGRARRR